MCINITESKIVKKKYGNDITLEKKLYIECVCGSLKDMARVCLFREYDQDPKDANKYNIVLEEVDIEFNATTRSEPSISKIFRNWKDRFIYTFEKIWNRIKGAFNILVGRPVWFSTNLMLDFDRTKELISVLDKSLKEIENVQIRCNEQDNKNNSGDI